VVAGAAMDAAEGATMTVLPIRLPRWSRLACWLPWVLLLGCAGLPEFTPGVTRRTEVLLALGEPVLALDQDRVLVHVWLPSSTRFMIPARGCYREEAGVRRRIGVALPTTSMQAPQGGRIGNHVVHEFDAAGVLLRRLPGTPGTSPRSCWRPVRVAAC